MLNTLIDHDFVDFCLTGFASEFAGHPGHLPLLANNMKNLLLLSSNPIIYPRFIGRGKNLFSTRRRFSKIPI